MRHFAKKRLDSCKTLTTHTLHIYTNDNSRQSTSNSTPHHKKPPIKSHFYPRRHHDPETVSLTSPLRTYTPPSHTLQTAHAPNTASELTPSFLILNEQLVLQIFFFQIRHRWEGFLEIVSRHVVKETGAHHPDAVVDT